MNARPRKKRKICLETILIKSAGKCLLKAVWEENLNQIESLVEANCDINQKFEVFPKHKVDGNFYHSIRNCLKKSKLPISAGNSIEFSVLDLAICKGSMELVQTLLNLKIDVNLKSGNFSPIEFALTNRSMAELLLENTENLKIDGSMIEQCIQMQNHEALKLLLEKAKDFEIDEKIIKLCMRTKHNENLKLLLEKNVNFASRRALGVFILGNDVEGAGMILERGCDPNCDTGDEMWENPPLELAVKRRNLEMVKKLFFHGARINCHKMFKYVVRDDCVELFRLLLQHFNWQGKHWLNYLWTKSVKNDALEILKILFTLPESLVGSVPEIELVELSIITKKHKIFALLIEKDVDITWLTQLPEYGSPNLYFTIMHYRPFSKILILLIQTENIIWRRYMDQILPKIENFRAELTDCFPEYFDGNAIIVSNLVCDFLFAPQLSADDILCQDQDSSIYLNSTECDFNSAEEAFGYRSFF